MADALDIAARIAEIRGRLEKAGHQTGIASFQHHAPADICFLLDAITATEAKLSLFKSALTDAEKELDTERYALSAAREETWQPIETAPKDGTDILVIRFGQESWPTYNIVHFNEADLGSKTHPWCFGDGGGAYHRDFPTHWQPLPEPPRAHPDNRTETK